MLLWVYIHTGQAWKICLATVGFEPTSFGILANTPTQQISFWFSLPNLEAGGLPTVRTVPILLAYLGDLGIHVCKYLLQKLLFKTGCSSIQRDIKRQSPLKPSKIENTWHIIFSSDTLMCTQKRGGVCFLKYYFKRRKLSKPDTYPRFAKLAKKIVSHGFSKISFFSIGVPWNLTFRF
jgi:hypothetical protein